MWPGVVRWSLFGWSGSLASVRVLLQQVQDLCYISGIPLVHIYLFIYSLSLLRESNSRVSQAELTAVLYM